jgi:FAD/FMN-containing dehydrogenase/Fe-S oxidoreductase
MSRALLPLVDDVTTFWSLLKQSVRGEVRWDRLSRALYSTDASVYQIVPLGVVLPRTEEDILATLRACARFGVPLTARGGGTSQAGQCIGPGVVLDCSKHFNDILEINAAERWVRVRPGCVLDDLNQAVRPHGLHFAPDISTANRATLGGMIANNSSGTHSVIHGKTIDHVLELKVALADGSVIHSHPLTDAELKEKCSRQDLEGECYRTVRRLAAEHADEIERRFPKILRRVGGYNLDQFTAGSFNLAHLFVGSEGTLGVVLEAKLRLIESPRARGLLAVQFDGLLDALAATPLILTQLPSAVEVMDRYILDATKLNAEASRLRDFLCGDPAAVLLIEFYGDRPEDISPRLAALEADLRRCGHGTHFLHATDEAAQQRAWKLRTLALGLSMAEKGDAKAISFVEDTAVAPEHLRDYIEEFLAVVARHGTRAGVYAHASVGCLHVRPVVDLKTQEGVHRFEAIAADVADLVLKYGGALSGEHGDGLVRSPFQEKMFGPALYAAFRELKRTFDPLGLLNPGKIIDAPSLASNLRYGPAYVTPEVPTTFDFSAEGGMTRAAELCAGVGECRKRRGGSMCPSYRATREEQHVTRGRANALRLALTGQVGLSGLSDPALKEVLDLCLECKACKSECPTNVDMARLKAEVLHQYYREHGLPWRNWIFGNVAKLTRWGGQLGNRWMRSKLGRWLNEKLFGIDRRRVPPALAKDPFYMLALQDQFFYERAHPPERGPDGRPKLSGSPVLIFPDTFTRLYEPEVGMAAIAVLLRLGCQVVVGEPDVGIQTRMHPPERRPNHLRCCGRPMISNGMLDEAVRLARHNVEMLYPWSAAGKPIIACEPSCILTMKDDYPALLRGDERGRAEVVASACLTVEEFLDRLPALRCGSGPKKILVQGHCHQRSLVGMGPLLRLLRRIPSAEVIDLDAGCCGMAGSFGYEKEHYEMSRLVGEQQLFPALRRADFEDVIVAPGFSCRMQIAHFTGRVAVHPTLLLRALLDENPSASGK